MFSLMGGPDYCQTSSEDASCHECCYDRGMMFRDLTVFDYRGHGESTLIRKVTDSGDKICTLLSTHVSFITDE